MGTIDEMIRQAVRDAPEWTDADREEYCKAKEWEARKPGLDFHALHGVPKATRRAILGAGVAAGGVPIIGGIGGFEWEDLVALGLAKKVYCADRFGEVYSIAFQYTGPGYLNVEGTFTTAGKWFDEGGGCE